MSLGLKDEVSKQLKKIEKEFAGTDEKAKKVESAIRDINKALNTKEDPKITEAVRNLIGLLREGGAEAKGLSAALDKVNGAKVFGEISKEAEKAGKSVGKMLGTLLGGKGAAGMSMHEIAKKAADYSKELAALDTRLKKAAHDGKGNDMKGDPTKDMREQIKNAQTFLDLIQRIDLKQKEIAQKKAEQPNVNTKELERANTLLEKFGTTLMDIMRKGNVDGSAVMGNFPKALQATMRETGDIMAQFAKNNTLSVFVNGADRANVAISNLETKIKDLQRLMSEGSQKGYRTDMLPDNIRYMQLRLTELKRLFEDNWQRMTDKPYMNSLFSDIAKTMTLARNAEHEYGKEKARTIAVTKAQEEAEKKHKEAVIESGRAAQEAYNQEIAARRKASAEFAAQLKTQMESRYRKEDMASAEKAAKAAEEARNEARVEEILQQKAHARELAAQKEAEAERNAAKEINKALEAKAAARAKEKKEQEQRELFANQEADRDRQAYLKRLDREGKALQRKAEIEQRLAEQQQHARDKQSRAENEQRNSLVRLETQLKNIDALMAKSASLKVDTSELKQARDLIQDIKVRISGMSGKALLGQTYKDIISKMRDGIIQSNSAMREQSRLNREAEQSKARIGKAQADEESNQRKINLLLSDANRLARSIEGTGNKTSTLGLDSKVIAEAAEKMRQMKEKIGGTDVRDNKAVKDLINEYRILIGEIRETKKEQDKLNAAEERSREAADKKKIHDEAEAKAKAARDTERLADAENRRKKVLADIEVLLENISRLSQNGAKLGVNTLEIDNFYGKIAQAGEAIKGLGREDLLGRGLKDAVNELDVLKTKAHQAMKDQSAANKEAAKASEMDAKREDAIDKLRAKMAKLEADKTRLETAGEKGKGLLSKEELDKIGTAITHVTSDIERLNGALAHTGDFSTKEIERLTKTARNYSPTVAAANARISAAKEQQRLQEEVARTAAKVRTDLAKSFEQAKEKASGLSSTMQDLKSLFLQGGVVYGAQQFVMSVIQTGGELEKQHIALQSILGDMQNANTMFAQVKELALNSSFTFSELNKDVKQLAAYGVEYDDLYDTAKRLADMSSGLGVSFERIALAFGQVQARGWLDGKELRQIAYAGIPLLEKLSEYYSKREGRKVSTSEVKTRISGRGVDFEDVKNIFWEMTDAGGQFYNMQQVLSETLLGRYNKLKDAWEIMLSEFASGNSLMGSGLKKTIDLVTWLVQSLHTMAPAVAAAFAGPLLGRIGKAIGGGLDKALLSVKGQMADEATRKAMEGKKLNGVERDILRTKNQITAVDIRNLAKANALTQAELRRLYVTGKITGEMYKQGMALAKQQNQSGQLTMMERMRNSLSGWISGGGSKWGALGGLALGGLKSLGSSILGFFGGLPGIAISAFSAIWAYNEQKSAELKQEMEQSLNELKDRATQMGEFLRDNNADKTIAEGDEKAIDNMIDAYKEKLREISPESAQAFKMHADEIASHKERLKYLQQQLELLQKANATAQEKSQKEDTYEKLRDDTKSAVEATNELLKAAASLKNVNLTGNEKGIYDDAKEDFDKYIEYLGEKYKKEFKDLKDSPEQQEAFRALRDNMLALQGASEDGAIQIRSALNRYLGLEDTEMETAFSKKLMNMVDSTFPEIADRIRAHKELDAESKKKVDNLMRGAVSQLSVDYPQWEKSLQNLLRNSDFEARIRLVYDTGAVENFDPFTQRVYNNALGTNITKWKENAEKFNELKPLLKGVTDMYTARNNAKTELETRYNKWQAEEDAKKKGKGDENTRQTLEKSYKDLWNASYMGLGYSYTPEGKKSNKVPKAKGGREEDKELKELQQRLEDFKAARQMYQKLVKDAGMGKQAARDKTVKLFPDLDWKSLDLDKYEASVRRLREGFNFDKSTERKKFRTQIDREAAEWEISEKLKPEFERVAANFKEALEKGLSQANLEQELLEKTGNKDFAGLAWLNGAVWDEHTRKMLDDFRKEAGTDIDLNMTDADAKKLYENKWKAYALWQKITTLVKDKYVKSLQSAADIMAETATTEEKLRAIDAKYAEKISLARASGDNGLAERYTQAKDKEKGQVKSDAFKGSADYLMFFEAIDALGKDRAAEIATQIRSQLNQALADGSLDAREYAKQIAQVEEQLDKLGKGRKTVWNAGFQGAAEQKIANGTTLFNKGGIEVAEGEKMKREGKVEGDLNKQIKGDGLILAGRVLMQAGTELQGAGRKIKEGWEGAVKTMDNVDRNIQGIVNAFGDVKDTMGALGFDIDSDGWQDATAVMNSLSGMSTGVKNAINGFATGDIGGGIAGALSVITSPIKAFAAAHDAKMDRQIKLAERSITELERTRDYVKSMLDKTLGGVYEWKMDADTRKTLEKVVKGKEYSEDTKTAASTALDDPTNAYNAERASLLAQRDEMQRQRNAENKKKKKDKDKLADYDEELKQMNLTIKQLSTDFLKDVYGVDMKSWASQLTDAVVSAWEKGEDAIDAYRKKAKEMVKDLTKNILSQKIMEKAMEKPLEYLTNIIEEKGKLDDTDMPKLIDGIVTAGENATYNITKILDGLKAQGYDFSESGSGTVSNSVKNITEETADILASYLNACRADVAMIRKMQGQYLPEMSETTKAQLVQLSAIATNTLRTAQASESIKVSVEALSNNIERVINGVKKIHVQ